MRAERADNEGTARPHFVLSNQSRTIVAYGTAATYPDPYEAAAALRDGRAQSVVGALPFDLQNPAALTVPQQITDDVVFPGPADPPTLNQVAQSPAPVDHVERVRHAVELIGSGTLRKVVLARSVDFESDAPLDPLAIAGALRRRDVDGNSFAVELGAGHDTGRWLVGSSPEVLVERRGDQVCCHPFAGTATSPDGLIDSAKDREEHAYVVDEIATALAPLCAELDIPDEPSVTQAGPVWHLGTRIVGRVATASTTALDLALALHPTAAVCGVPRADAAAAIAAIEGDRGFYAGAVGWTGADGDGHWRVAIRCAELEADSTRLRAFAGGGIVATSDPDAELAETENKLRTILGPFRVREAAVR